MTRPNLTPAEALECLRSWDDTTVEWDAWACRYSNHLNGGPDEDACLRRRCFKIIGELLSEHESVKAKLAAYEAKMPSAFDMVNDAYPFAIAIRDERVGRTLSTPASGVPSLRSAMKDAFRVITGEPLVVEAKEPAAAVPSDEEIARQLLAIRFSPEESQVRVDRLCLLLTDIVQRIGVKL